jgi:hypothetical protein
MTIEADEPKQRMGVLTVQRVTPAGYKVEFQPLKDKQTDPPPRHESEELADDASLERYLGPFVPYTSPRISARDLVARIEEEQFLTVYICCSPMWEPTQRTSQKPGRINNVN